MRSLRLVSADPSDRGSQRCRLGPGLMAALGLRLGSPVLVSVPGGSCLCTAWPRSDLTEDFLQVDLKCFSPGLISQVPSKLILDPSQLRPVPCPKLKSVTVTVVVQSPDFRRTSGGLVHELVKDLLQGVSVHQDFVVDLEDYRSPIRYVVVDHISPESGGSGLITSNTAVGVSGVQTVQHYKSQLQDRQTPPLGGLEEVSWFILIFINIWCF